MKLISAKCPNCGGHLKIEEGTTKTVCEYCKKDILIDDESIKIKISGRVSVDGIKTDKELIDSANELLDMGEYIKAKKLFDQFATNNPDQYQGWLGLLICRTRNFQIRDNNILFENDIEKYYKYFQRTASEDVKDDYFETIDRYMYPDKWKEIDKQREKERQEEIRKKEEEERQKKYASAIEENKKLREEKEAERQERIAAAEKERQKREAENRKEYERKEEEKRIKKANGTYVGPGEVIGQILSYLHIAWTVFVAFACLISSFIPAWLIFNISIVIFLPPLRKFIVKKGFPYFLIIIIRVLVVIISYVVFIVSIEKDPSFNQNQEFINTWVASDETKVSIVDSKYLIIEENDNKIKYSYMTTKNDDSTAIHVTGMERNYIFLYKKSEDKIDFCLLNDEGTECLKYYVPEKPDSNYRYRTDE